MMEFVLPMRVSRIDIVRWALLTATGLAWGVGLLTMRSFALWMIGVLSLLGCFFVVFLWPPEKTGSEQIEPSRETRP
jgi:hypothetical protein